LERVLPRPISVFRPFNVGRVVVLEQRLERTTEHDFLSGWMLIHMYVTRFVVEYSRPSYAHVPSAGTPISFFRPFNVGGVVVLIDPAARHFTDENVDKLFIAGCSPYFLVRGQPKNEGYLRDVEKW